MNCSLILMLDKKKTRKAYLSPQNKKKKPYLCMSEEVLLPPGGRSLKLPGVGIEHSSL